MSGLFDPIVLLVILGGAIATYITRIGGYVMMKCFKNIHPRVEAGLNAVPVAVLTTLVAPTFFEGGIEVKIGMIFALIVGLKIKGLTMIAAGWALVVGARHFGLV